MPTTYWQKLQDPCWQKRRLEIFKQSDFACQDCKNKEDMLTVHHSYYEKGLEPWEYSDDALVCLCVGCHEDRAEGEHLLLRQVKQFKSSELYDISFYLSLQMQSGFTPKEIVRYIWNGIPRTESTVIECNPS